jgi:ribosomal-protein-alanine N-acetyltransferase
MLLQGPRLRLRPIAPADAESFAALNADQVAMRHFPAPLSRAESDAALDRALAHQAEHGFGAQAVERHDGVLLGFLGLAQVQFAARFTPAVEIGWRFLPAYWGHGYAEEAARLTLAHGFGPLGLAEIVSFTVPANQPSWRLMQRLGMRADGGFDHPRVPQGHPLRPHLLYRLARADWVAQLFG